MDLRRLGDSTPYALPVRDELLWFLCRFESDVPIGVALPADASEAERAMMQRALDGWQQALGVRFTQATPEAALIEIAFEADDARYAASTETECRVERAADATAARDRLPARLVHARVGLRRAQLDWRGHVAPLDEAQQLGALLHELGHALGYQGHARGGDTVMQRNLEHVHDVARGLLAGAPFHDAALAALYRVDSGSLVQRAALPPGRSAPSDRLLRIATLHGDGSVEVRVGDTTGRIAARNANGELLRVFLRNMREALRDPARLELAADPELIGITQQP